MGRGLYCRGLKVVKNIVTKAINMIKFAFNVCLIKGYQLYGNMLNRKIYRLNQKQERLYSQIIDAVNNIDNYSTYYDNVNPELTEYLIILSRSRVRKRIVIDKINYDYSKLDQIEKKRIKLSNTNKILRP